jgi:hypothetical protein
LFVMYKLLFLSAPLSSTVMAQMLTTAPLYQGAVAPTSSVTLLAGTLTTGLAASIVSAEPCHTTYAFVCTDGNLCATEGWTYYLTAAASTFELHYTSSENGTAGTARETCSVQGSTYAVCSETVAYSSSGGKSTASTTVTASGTDVHFAEFPITAGAEKIASATEICRSKNALGGAEVVKVMVVPAAAIAALVAGVLT